MSGIGAWGSIVFEVSQEQILTFDRLRQTKRGRYSTLNVANYEQLLQYDGRELQTVSFTVRLHHRFCDPQAELRKLVALVDGHSAYPLIVGGWAIGEFVLEELGSDWKRVADNGVLMYAEGDLYLREYL